MNRSVAVPPGRVALTLGLKLNARLARLMPNRTEYGDHKLHIGFEIEAPHGGFRVVTEDKFALHRGPRQVGVFGTRNPVEALKVLFKTYPDATVLMRIDGKSKK